MATIRAQIVEMLQNDSTFSITASGGVWGKPIVSPGQYGWEEDSWVIDPDNPMVGFILPTVSVTDVDETVEADAQLIYGTAATVYVMIFGPPNDSGKTALRTLKERAYELLNQAELWLDVEGAGLCDLEWREATKIVDSDRLPGAIETTVRFAASYLKQAS